ncbi:hypothetical protein [Nonomuraea bangladeshensis]|uniref:hypothetical protein n=1 Tax=Nonomuraea bangladeshensis TaxID=404385 RepID=UPI003C2EA0BD
MNSTVEYYKTLMGDLDWLGPSMGWTVVSPHRGGLSTEQIVARLGLDPTPTPYVSEVGIAGEVSLGQAGSSMMLFEASAISFIGQPKFLAALSESAEVWHVSWTITGQSKLRVAENGELSAEIPDFDYKMARGPRVDVISPEIDLLRQVARRRRPTLFATAMAIVENRTGARLSREWLGTPQSTIAVEAL